MLKRMIRQFRVLFALFVAVSYFWFIPTAIAFPLPTPIQNLPIALLRQHHETTGQLRYHSHASVLDRTGHRWQVLLFPQPSPSIEQQMHLRLVGFPGVVEFIHPRSLEITTKQGKILRATDVYNQENFPATNVGEYVWNGVLNQLSSTDELKLRLPVTGVDGKVVVLTISDEIIAEWQLLMTQIEKTESMKIFNY